MISEEEAIKKRCPQKLANPNRTGVGSDVCCDASECMAWRTWNISSQNYDEKISECRDRGMTLEHAIKFVNEHSGNVGYCGLAGKP